MNTSKKQQESQWQTTPVANLVRNLAFGTYYAKTRVTGKLIWKSIETDRMTLAQLRLSDFPKQERGARRRSKRLGGKMTFEQALKTYEQRLNGEISLKERNKEYRRERIKALLKSWPDLKTVHLNGRAVPCRLKAV
jgi:hypothetical protein